MHLLKLLALRRPLRLATFCLAVLLAAAPPSARAYVLEGYHWPGNQPVVLDLQLGTPGYTLIDGSTSWDQVAEEAEAIWNQYLGDGVGFAFVTTVITPKQRDGVNSVFFSSTLYGDAFGDDTLATTLSFFNTRTGIKSEADVVFNTAFTFNSYRGPLRNGVDDIRRTLLHEFGHVLGLEHTPQTAQSIMTPVVTDLDTLQADDIAGVEAIYGPVESLPTITSALTATAQPGQPFTYQITARGTVTSFGATGLPPGLSVDPATGAITGTPTATGTYGVTLSVTGAKGIVQATLTLTVFDLPVITSATHATALVGQPFSYQILATGDPTSFSSDLVAGLSVNPTTGLLSGTPEQAGNFSINLYATDPAGSARLALLLSVFFDPGITILHDFGGLTDGDRPSNLTLGTDGNFYGTTTSGGAIGYGAFFRLTPAGVLTVLHQFNGGEGDGDRSNLVQAADGNFYGTVSSGGPTSGGAILRFTSDGTVTILHGFASTEASVPRGSLFLGNDGSLYGTTVLGPRNNSNSNGGGIVYRCALDGTLTTLQVLPYSDTGSSGLVQGADGSLYGTLPASVLLGTPAQIYKLSPDGALTMLCVLPGAGTGTPSALVLATDGNLYGSIAQITPSYNPPLFATAYRCTLDGAVTILHTFIGDASTSQPSALVQGQDGNFYGTTQGGFGSDAPAATVFEMTPNGTVTTLHSFSYGEGYAPGALVQAPDGSFYGSAINDDGGIVFNTHPLGTFVAAGPLPTVTLAATTPEVTIGSGGTAVLTLTLSAAQTTDTVVHYTVKGSAFNGTDYVELTGTKKIKAGKTSKPIKVTPLGSPSGFSKKTVKVTLAADPAYTVGTPDPVKVKILTAQ